MSIAPNIEIATPNNESDPRIMEGVRDHARINQSPNSPGQTRKNPARSQRKTSIHEDDNPTRRALLHDRRSSYSSGGISSDSDSTESSSVRVVRPGLKLPFNFKQTIVEEKVHTAAEPRVIRQSDRREAKEHRNQLYHESIQSFSHSRYAGDAYDLTIDLFTKNAKENKEYGQPELVAWM